MIEVDYNMPSKDIINIYQNWESVLSDNDLHGFAQWFSCNYSGTHETSNLNYPRDDVFDLVSYYIKSGKSKIGFVKWFAIRHGIYGKQSEGFIDAHFENKLVTIGLINTYFKRTLNNNLFELESIEDIVKRTGLKIIHI